MIVIIDTISYSIPYIYNNTYAIVYYTIYMTLIHINSYITPYILHNRNRMAFRAKGGEGLQLFEPIVADLQGASAGVGRVLVLVPREESGDCLVRAQLLLQAWINKIDAGT